MRTDKYEAIKLRKRGKSYTEISIALGIPKSTLSYWLRDQKISRSSSERLQNRAYKKSVDALVKRNKQQTIVANSRARGIREKSAKEVVAINNKILFFLGLALYWGEGYKKGAYGSKWKCVDFANSDPDALALMMRFFREICLVPEEKFRVQIVLHKHVSERQAKAYWSKLLGISEGQFIKSSNPAKHSKNKRGNMLKYGTVHIRVYSVDLFHELIGWIEGVKKQSNIGV